MSIKIKNIQASYVRLKIFFHAPIDCKMFSRALMPKLYTHVDVYECISTQLTLTQQFSLVESSPVSHLFLLLEFKINLRCEQDQFRCVDANKTNSAVLMQTRPILLSLSN